MTRRPGDRLGLGRVRCAQRNNWDDRESATQIEVTARTVLTYGTIRGLWFAPIVGSQTVKLVHDVLDGNVCQSRGRERAGHNVLHSPGRCLLEGRTDLWARRESSRPGGLARERMYWYGMRGGFIRGGRRCIIVNDWSGHTSFLCSSDRFKHDAACALEWKKWAEQKGRICATIENEQEKEGGGNWRKYMYVVEDGSLRQIYGRVVENIRKCVRLRRRAYVNTSVFH